VSEPRKGEAVKTEAVAAVNRLKALLDSLDEELQVKLAGDLCDHEGGEYLCQSCGERFILTVAARSMLDGLTAIAKGGGPTGDLAADILVIASNWPEPIRVGEA
jgi:hypothetical protein